MVNLIAAIVNGIDTSKEAVQNRLNVLHSVQHI